MIFIRKFTSRNNRLMYIGLKAKPWIYALLVLLLPLQIFCASRDTVLINRQMRYIRDNYYRQSYDTTVSQARDILNRSTASDYLRGISWAEYYMGKALLDQERLDSAVVHARRAEALFRRQPADVFGRVLGLCLVGDVIQNKDVVDSSLAYYYKAIDLIKSGQHDTLFLAYPYHGLGQNIVRMGDFARGHDYLQHSIALFQASGFEQEEASVLNTLGTVHQMQNNLFDALETHMQAMRLYVKHGNVEGELNQHNSIGHIYYMLNGYSKAMEHLKKALQLKQQVNNSNTSLLLLNIGTTLLRLSNYDSALHYANMAYRKAVVEEEASLQGSIAHLKGEVLIKLGQYDSAAVYLQRALTLFEQQGEVMDLAKTMVCLAEISRRTNRYADAERLLNEASRIQRTLRYSSNDLNLRLNRERYELCVARNDYRRALAAYEAYASIRDSLSQITAISSLDYLQHHAQRSMKRVPMQRRSGHMTAVVWALPLLLIIAIVCLILYHYRLHQLLQQHGDMNTQITTLNQRYSEFLERHGKIEEQKNLVMLQRDKIIDILSELGDSIAYAKKIQQVMLPQEVQFSSLFSEYFVFNSPRDSVSGDFYWVGSTNTGHTVFVVADCTGHGVPGGFMSMVGMSMITEIVARNVCETPASALNTLRDNIINAFRQNDRSSDNTDGMDIAMCVYRSEERKLYYAGANLSVFVATNRHMEPSERIRKCAANLYEIRPDRMPISYFENMESFTDMVIDLAPTDTIYLSSDGYISQFGGEKNRKYGSAAFRALLNRIKNLPFNEQKERLQNTLEEWMGANSQTDDILVLGVRPLFTQNNRND